MFESEAAARVYYGKFGITANKGQYNMVTNRDQRLLGSKQITKSLRTEGFENKKF